MTIIAYRDGVIASDSATQSGGLVTGNTQKIAKMPCGGIVGVAGLSVDCGAFLRWCEAGRPENIKPKLTDISALLIEADGTVKYFDHSFNWFERQVPFAAEGCGNNVAMGAMAAGATAIHAVEIAIRFDAGCGGPVQVLRIEPGVLPQISKASVEKAVKTLHANRDQKRR